MANKSLHERRWSRTIPAGTLVRLALAPARTKTRVEPVHCAKIYLEQHFIVQSRRGAIDHVRPTNVRMRRRRRIVNI